MRRLDLFSLLFLAASFAVPASAQNAISAKAGMINVADGDVFLVDQQTGEEKKVEPKVTEFIDMKEGQVLKTTEGRAEVLLTPGSFLRMADNSSVRLVSNRLSDVRVEVLSGSVMIESTELLQDNKLTVVDKDATVVLTKAGIYRFDAEPAQVRVYTGEATAEYGGGTTVLKAARELTLSASGWAVSKFDPEDTDALYRWSKRRSSYIAMANLSAAKQASTSIYNYSGGYGTGMGYGIGRWLYNPYFGFATYVPFASTCYSPFGFAYYSPYTVGPVYYYAPRTIYRGTPSAPSRGSGNSSAWNGSFPGGSSGGSISMPARSSGSLAGNAGASSSRSSVGGGAVSRGSSGAGIHR
jgi:hypothetical protein